LPMFKHLWDQKVWKSKNRHRCQESKESTPLTNTLISRTIWLMMKWRNQFQKSWSNSDKPRVKKSKNIWPRNRLFSILIPRNLWKDMQMRIKRMN
jgi:hypothetical protein